MALAEPQTASLAELLTEARREYAAALHVPITSKGPPTLFVGWDTSTCARHGEEKDLNAWCRCLPRNEEEPASKVGRSVSGRMLRYVGPASRHGMHFEVSRAIAWYNMSRCRRNHHAYPDHQIRPPLEPAIGSMSWHLCGRLVRAVVRDVRPVSLEALIRSAAERENLDVERAARLIDTALREMKQRREQWAHEAAS